jgi:hypothetical protein
MSCLIVDTSFGATLSYLTSCTPNLNNIFIFLLPLSWANLPHKPNLISIFLSLGSWANESVHVQGSLWHFITKFFFSNVEMLDARPTPKLEYYPMLTDLQTRDSNVTVVWWYWEVPAFERQFRDWEFDGFSYSLQHMLRKYLTVGHTLFHIFNNSPYTFTVPFTPTWPIILTKRP